MYIQPSLFLFLFLGAALEELEELLEDRVYATSFAKNEAGPAALLSLISRSSTSVRVRSVSVMSTACQNQLDVQALFLKNGAMDVICEMINTVDVHSS